MRWFFGMSAVAVVIAVTALLWKLSGSESSDSTTGESGPDRPRSAADGNDTAARHGGVARRIPPIRRPGGAQSDAAEPSPADVLPPSGPEAPASRPALQDASVEDQRVAQLQELGELYKHKDYEGARSMALEFIEAHGDDWRALRVLVLSLCAMGDPDAATYAAKLGKRQRARVQLGCQEMGFQLP